MKFIYSIVLILGFNSIIIAQGDFNPVEWQVEKISETDSEVEVAFTADIQKGWVIYSQETGEDGPIPTTFTFTPNKNIELVGNVVEKTEVTLGYDKMFEMQVGKMKGQAVFVQKIKKKDAETKLKGTITYMCCDNDKCLPPKDIVFSIDL